MSNFVTSCHLFVTLSQSYICLNLYLDIMTLFYDILSQFVTFLSHFSMKFLLIFSALSLRHHYAEDHTDIIEVCGGKF